MQPARQESAWCSESEICKLRRGRFGTLADWKSALKQSRDRKGAVSGGHGLAKRGRTQIPVRVALGGQGFKRLLSEEARPAAEVSPPFFSATATSRRRLRNPAERERLFWLSC